MRFHHNIVWSFTDFSGFMCLIDSNYFLASFSSLARLPASGDISMYFVRCFLCYLTFDDCMHRKSVVYLDSSYFMLFNSYISRRDFDVLNSLVPEGHSCVLSSFTSSAADDSKLTFLDTFCVFMVQAGETSPYHCYMFDSGFNPILIDVFSSSTRTGFVGSNMLYFNSIVKDRFLARSSLSEPWVSK